MKLKTIRINATMHTELYLDINVPENVTEDHIEEFVREGNIDGGMMNEHDGLFSHGWVWQEATDADKNSDAPDFSKEIKKYMEDKA